MAEGRASAGRQGSVDAIVRVGQQSNRWDGYHALPATTWPRFTAIIVSGDDPPGGSA